MQTSATRKKTRSWLLGLAKPTGMATYLIYTRARIKKKKEEKNVFVFNKFRNFVFLFRSSSLLNLNLKIKKKKIGFDYIKTLGSLVVASRFIALDGPLSHSSVRASDVFGEPNLFGTPAAVPTRHNRPNRHSPLYTVCIECLGREDAHATWPFLSASNNDRRQFECHTKRSYRRLYSRVRANGK
jgi:hypothetical protein